MQLDDLNVLAAFLAVAEERSFTRAAKRVGVSRSALSHAVRGLEERIGVRLLSRTTRSVAPTAAGEQLIGRLRPALGDVALVLDEIAGLGERAGRACAAGGAAPGGEDGGGPETGAVHAAPTRTSCSTSRPTTVHWTWSPAASMPGFTLANLYERDMIATRVSRDQRAAIVGSQRYFDVAPQAQVAARSPNHRCINICMGPPASTDGNSKGLEGRRRVASRVHWISTTWT